MKRVFVIVLDSCGIGEAPDAAAFGDVGSNTLKSAAKAEGFAMPNMARLGLFNIDGIDWREGVAKPEGAYARLTEASMGKDTTIGHWEMAGLISPDPMPTFPDGFPAEVMEKFEKETGRGWLVNKPYSGTTVINEYGDEHVKTGKLIVYTSADSVFQIAAHEDIVPCEQLYEYCRIARRILKGKYAVGRVIARPFIGSGNGNYTRTPRRHDFSLEPTGVTILDQIKDAGMEVLSVGKIRDIFAGRGITDYVYTQNNAEGIERTLEWMDRDFKGLCFTNLVDTDMIYGHRRDIQGYGDALSYFDRKLGEMMKKLRPEDLLIMTADHGCDPGFTKTTDHTREYVPFVACGAGDFLPAGNYGTRSSFADLGATVLKYLGIPQMISGTALV
ncbi:MAG: phosphopentomutase [Lachnospiraceae bacterium]|nr:phosphopentomutase [Lachnospiraceae bacterium]